MTLKEEIARINAQAAKISKLRIDMEDELKALNASQAISNGYASSLPSTPAK